MSTASARRAVLNVATHHYVEAQGRLVRSLKATGWGGGVLTWTDELPPGSPPHDVAPYGFKLYAIAEAMKKGCSSLLWLDAPCVVAKPLDPVFDAIERDGHCFVSSGEKLGNWAGDDCLAAFGIPRDAAMSIPLLNGAFIGLDLEHARSREWFRRITQQCETGLFKGAALTEHAPADVRARNVDKDTGHLSDDPRCWGHRHDEAVGSCLAPLLGMEFTPQGELFDLKPGSAAIVRYESP